MAVLAALASFLFPGAGQAFTGRIRPIVAWGVAGLVPVLLVLAWPPLVFLAVAVRAGAALHAWRVVGREAPGTRHLTSAGIAAVANAAALALVRLLVVEAFAPLSVSMAPTLTIGDHVFVDKLGPRFTGYARGDVVVFDHPAGYKYLKRIAGGGGDRIAIRHGVLYVNDRAAPVREIGPTSYWDQIDPDGEQWVEREVIAWEETLGDHAYRIYHAPDALRSDSPLLHDFPDPSPLDPTVDPCTLAVVSATMGVRAVYAQPRMTATRDRQACTVPAGTYFMLGDNRDNSNDSRSWGVVPADKLIGRVVGVWWSRSQRRGIDLSRLGRID